MPDRVSCKVLRATEDLEQFAPAWRKLWHQSLLEQVPQATPFHSPEWLLPWWHSFGQPTVRAVVLSHGAEPVGLLPFYVYREPGARERRLLPIGISTTDYLGGLFSPACTDDDVEAGLRTLLTDAEWDEMIATQLRSDARVFRVMPRLCPNLERFQTESCSRTPALRLSELPQKIRRNAMYYRNRALRLGTLELTVADESNWPEALDALVDLHSARWQVRGEEGVLSDDRVIAMHREAIPLLLAADLLRLCCLRLNGEIIAVLYSLIDPPERAERKQYFYLPAFSPAHAELRPGTLLMALAMERAVDEGVRVIDMLRGEEAYKQIWHMERTPTFGFQLSRLAERQAAIAAVA
jgi:CelD/BcsL family acetyltransferase involved in cellulose biosynthesis